MSGATMTQLTCATRVLPRILNGKLPCRVTAQGNFAEPVAADLITQILDGVAYLHNLGA